MDQVRTEHPSLVRIGAFSDGVFAFAITLLILGIRVPHPTDSDAAVGLLNLLAHQWRSYLAYVLSFLLVGINWANHRVMFSIFDRANQALVWLNLIYLMLAVAIIPLPAAVLGAWLGASNHQNEMVAAVFYGLVALIGSLTYNALWLYGAYVARLTSTHVTASKRRAHTMAWGASPLVIAILTAIAFISPTVAVVGFVAVIFAYMLPLGRLLTRTS